MKRLLVLLLLAGCAPAAPKKVIGRSISPSAAPPPSRAADPSGRAGSDPRVAPPDRAPGIRAVDFFDFTYERYPLCAPELENDDYLPCRGRSGRSITVAQGEARKLPSRFGSGGVEVLDVAYADVDGDGRDDALVTHGYDMFLGNGSIQGSLVLVYRWSSGRATVLTHVSFADVEDDLVRASGQDVLWYPGITARPDGSVEVSVLAGVPRARPPYRVTATYRYRSGAFRRVGRAVTEPSEL